MERTIQNPEAMPMTEQREFPRWSDIEIELHYPNGLPRTIRTRNASATAACFDKKDETALSGAVSARLFLGEAPLTVERLRPFHDVRRPDDVIVTYNFLKPEGAQPAVGTIA